MASTNLHYSVQVSVSGLGQRSVQVISVRTAALGANVVKRGERAGRGDFEDRPIAICSAQDCCSIKITVGGLDDPRLGKLAVFATTLRAKAVQGRERTVWRDFEDCPIAVSSTRLRRAVEVPIYSLDQPGKWILAICACRFRAKAVQKGERAVCRDFENDPIALGPASVSCPVKMPIGCLQQSGQSFGTVWASEAV